VCVCVCQTSLSDPTDALNLYIVPVNEDIENNANKPLTLQDKRKVSSASDCFALWVA
jgi:hypothetical protein